MRRLISRRARAPPRVVEPRTTLKPKPLHDLGDQLAVAMLADQDVHLGPVPVIGREEHDLVEERVDIPLAGRAGHFGGDHAGLCTGNGS